MKNLLKIAVKFLIVLATAAVPYFVFRTGHEWWLTELFAYTLIVPSAYVFMGATASLVFLVLALVVYGLVFLKAIAAHAALYPFAAGIIILVTSYILVRKVNDANEHFIDNARDELKALEGGYSALINEQKSLETGLEANRAKLDKYVKLKQIQDGVAAQVMFSDKLRHILRNVINIFHREKAITLFLAKENMAIKVYADQHEDEFSGDPDHESVFLKNFDEWVIKNKRSIIVSDMRKEVRFTAEDGEKIRSLIGVPVIKGDKTVGLLRVTSDTHGSFNQEDLRFLDLIAVMVCRVLEGENYA